MKRYFSIALLLLVACATPMWAAGPNLMTNPNFELNNAGVTDLNARTLDDCLAWSGTGGDTRIIADTAWGDDHPGAQMMARIGRQAENNVSQDTGVIAKAHTIYRLVVDCKSEWSWAMALNISPIDGDAWQTGVTTGNLVMNHHPAWKPYSMEIDTDTNPEFVGLKLGVRIIMRDWDWGHLYATNVRLFAIDKQAAREMVPADEDEHVGTVTNGKVEVNFQWKPGEDAENPGVPLAAIRKYYVYLSEDQATSTDPNLYLTGEVDAGSPLLTDLSFGPLTLNMDGRYFWAVEEALDTGNGLLPAGDPNNIMSPYTQFDTVKSIPVIEGQSTDQLVFAGESSTMTLSVVSASPLSYSWYQSTDNSTDTPQDDVLRGTDAELNIAAAQVSDEGYYYCKVTNNGGTVLSAPALLAIKRAVAHWSFDQADYVDGQYVDLSGEGHNATVTGTPAFGAGIAGDAVTIDDSNGWAGAGDWDPASLTGRMTISAWVKWDGATWGTPHGIVTKWSSTSNHFALIARSGDGSHSGTNYARFFSASNQLWAGPGTFGADEWVQVCAVTDGTNGTIYINGVPQASGAMKFGGDPAAPIAIGISRVDTAGVTFPGALDDIQIFNYDLSQREVVQMYHDVTGKSVCVNPYASQWDLNNDCRVNLEDFALFSMDWLSCGLYPICQ